MFRSHRPSSGTKTQNLEHKYVCIEMFRNLNIFMHTELHFKLCVLLLMMVYKTENCGFYLVIK